MPLGQDQDNNSTKDFNLLKSESVTCEGFEPLAFKRRASGVPTVTAATSGGSRETLPLDISFGSSVSRGQEIIIVILCSIVLKSHISRLACYVASRLTGYWPWFDDSIV
jgi:hypothetical protein